MDIVDSDAFLDMPDSTQNLYFHMNMRADDDGFISNPKRIMRMLGASDDDMKILIAKRFIITFDDGVCVVKHWQMHNGIRKDRYTPTRYLAHRQTLALKENKAYTENKENAVAELPSADRPDWQKTREEKMKSSSLPYSFTYKIRQAFEGEHCPICDAEMRSASKKDSAGISTGVNKPTIQHNTPLSDGGEHELDNISVICKKCNISIKHEKTEKLNNDKVKSVWQELSQPNKNQSATNRQRSIGKDRIGKDRKDLASDDAGDDTQQLTDSIVDDSKKILNQQIVDVIDSFVVVNSSNTRWYGNKTQRSAIEHLIKTHTFEQVMKVVTLLPKSNVLPYFPQITTPHQLADKWDALSNAFIRKKNEHVGKTANVIL